MISSGQLLGYAIASFLIIVVPGPGVLFVVGRGQLKQVNPKPERTVETVKEIPDTIKGAVRS